LALARIGLLYRGDDVLNACVDPTYYELNGVPHSVNPLAHETRTSASPLCTVVEMKEKYDDTLQVDGVVGEDDDKSADELNEPLQPALRRFSGCPPGPKIKVVCS
jgi:hypothetical protein